LGFSEIFLIMAVALILFGPEDLPDIARTIGKIVFQVRQATQELTKEFQNSMDAPKTMMNKAFEQTTSAPSNEQKTQTQPSGVEASNKTDEVLLKYDDESSDDPLAELPLDMVSYEEKGASR
jgi:Tat protein translocase TatB subunit